MDVLVVSAAEAAKMLSIKAATLHEELETGRLKAYRDGRNWKIPVEALHEYVNTRATNETKERRVRNGSEED